MSEEAIAEARQSFLLFDKNKDGRITTSEIGKALQANKVHKSEDELKAIIREVDGDGDGAIDFTEFLHLLAKTPNNSESDLKEAFAAFDKDGDQLISTQELCSVMDTLSESLSQQEVEELLRVADHDGDGKLSF